MSTRATGDFGEAFAADWLVCHGWRLLERGFHCRYGEVDIIAAKGEILAFVEVKTRSGDALARPAAAVTRAKRQRISITARYYLQQHPMDLQPRFDVFEIYVRRGGDRPQVTAHTYIEGAFDYDGPV